MIAMSPKFPTIFTPQGDGNVKTTLGELFSSVRFPTIFTPQGDGNSINMTTSESFIDYLIPDNIYPARGRKRDKTKLVGKVFDFRIPDNIYPARGRKL